MSKETGGSNRLQELALNFARKDFPIIRDSLSVGEALNVIRQQGVGERIIYFYIVNDEGQLVGIVATRRLLISRADQQISNIMITDIVTLSDRTTVQRACEMFVDHELFAFPIVDGQNRVLGVIDIGFYSEESISVVERQKIQAIFDLIGFGIAQLQGRSAFGALRYRLPWLLIIFVFGVLCASVAEAYGATLVQNIVVVAFLVLILGLGESVSTQSVTLTLQNLEFDASWKNYWAELKTEALTTLLLGIVCGSLAAGPSWFWSNNFPVSLTIGVSALLSIVIAGLIGVAVPTLLRPYVKIAAGPISHALTYFAILLLYLTTARLVLS